MTPEILTIIGIGIVLAGLILNEQRVSSAATKSLRAEIAEQMAGQRAEIAEQMAGQRAEIAKLRTEMAELRTEVAQLRERMAHLEGLLEGLREAITHSRVA